VSGGDREDERERTTADVSKSSDDIETGAWKQLRDEPGGCPLTGQVVSGMEVARARSAAFGWNRRRRVRIPPAQAGGRGELRSGELPQAGSEYPLPDVPADRPVVVMKAL
jgi:hypothetical protein